MDQTKLNSAIRTATGQDVDPDQGFTVGWSPFAGGQTLFLSCPIREIFAEGNRGGGKTETLLVKFLAEVGKYGDAWQGIIFRREYKHLDDLVAKSKRLFRKLGVKARWLSSKSDYKWVFETGEELKFRAAKDPEDYWDFHGHEYPFIGWEELTNYPDDRVYESMRSLNRCSVAGVPRMYLSTGNPFGAGHGWVKARFLLGPDGRTRIPRGQVQIDPKGNMRVCLHLDLEDNLELMKNDPEYAQNLEGITNEALRKAWRDGDWDIVVGGFLQGVWDYQKHIVEPFAIPKTWPRWRAMDWGFASPFSVGWYTKDPDTGVIYRYRELYGWGGKPNVGTRQSADEVAQMILDIEAMETKAGIQFKGNPADTNMWAAMPIRQAGALITPAEIMRKMKVLWTLAKKGPGSRVAGAQVIISLLKANKFKVFNTCEHFIRTVPVLMPDEHNWEDVDTEMEDHAWDEVRYSLTSRHQLVEQGKPKDEGPKPGTFDWLLQYGNEPRRRSIYRSV